MHATLVIYFLLIILLNFVVYCKDKPSNSEIEYLLIGEEVSIVSFFPLVKRHSPLFFTMYIK